MSFTRLPIIRTLFLGLLLSFCSVLNAGHIVGGEFTYSCQGWLNDDPATNVRVYRLRINVYRDIIGQGAYFDGAPSGTGPDGNTSAAGHISIYEGTTLYEATLPIFLGPVADVPINLGNPCLQFVGQVGQEVTVYEFTVNLPVSSQPYTLAYQRCCRNDAIVNLRDAADIGSTYFITITPDAQQLCNASPEFNIDPPIVICANQPFQIDFGATDRENDSLVYKLCNPVLGGGNDGVGGPPQTPTTFDDVVPLIESPPPYSAVTFRAGYDVANQLGVRSTLAIDDSTGILSGIPANQGTFALAVCIEEWRVDTVTGTTFLISETKREFQFTVGVCGNQVQADLLETEVDAQGRFYIKQCGPGPNTLINESTRREFIDEYDWIIEGQGNTFTGSSRDLTADFDEVGIYTGQMIINRSSFAENCRDTADVIVEVFPAIYPDFEYVEPDCDDEPVAFTNLSRTQSTNVITGYQWDFMDGSDGSTQTSPLHQFRIPGTLPIQLTATDDNACEADTIIDIDYFPSPRTLLIQPDRGFGCVPFTKEFENLSRPINEEYIFDWRFGDGNVSDESSPSHIYEEAGVYSVYLGVTSPTGCFVDTTFVNLVDVRNAPTADFFWTPEQPTNLNPDIFVQDASLDAARQSYVITNELGERVFAIPRPNFEYTVRDSGTLFITQFVAHPSGCTDTITKDLQLEFRNTYFLPNAFTPNGDGLNDIFLPKGIFGGITAYQLRVWTRYGENIFVTEDINQGWDGSFNGAQSPGGGYLWDVQYVDANGDPMVLKGGVTLVR